MRIHFSRCIEHLGMSDFLFLLFELHRFDRKKEFKNDRSIGMKVTLHRLLEPASLEIESENSLIPLLINQGGVISNFLVILKFHC
jgi:hypothetical protein